MKVNQELKHSFNEECNNLIERHSIVLLISFSFYGLLSLYKGLLSFFLWHLFCTCLIIYFNYFFLKNKAKKVKVLLGYSIVCLDILFFNTIGGYKTGMDLFYIPLMFSLPLFFNFVRDKHLVIISFTIIMSSMVLSLILREFFYNEFYYNLYNGFLNKHFLIINVTLVSIAIGIILYSIHIRHSLYHEQWSVLMDKSLKLNEMNQKLKKLNNVSELIGFAKKNDPGFYQKFILLYPDIATKLSLLNPNIRLSELEFCAYLKLNFSTKQIAMYTKSSIKSVECKKYRIRKKFNLNSNEDIYIWINSI